MHPLSVTTPAFRSAGTGSTGGTVDERRGPFGRTLKHCRESRRVSQSKLAELAGFDHSYVSRLESGSRTPTRDAVGQLAIAMQLDADDHDRLLAAAGYVPKNVSSLLDDEPQVAEVVHLLSDPRTSDVTRDIVRAQLAGIADLVRQAVISPG